jgi:hypothetical protein
MIKYKYWAPGKEGIISAREYYFSKGLQGVGIGLTGASIMYAIVNVDTLIEPESFFAVVVPSLIGISVGGIMSTVCGREQKSSSEKPISVLERLVDMI